MRFLKLGVLIVGLLGMATACAAESPAIHAPADAQVGQSLFKQTTIKGQGLKSLLAELARMGIDPNKLNVTLADGTFLSPFSVEVTDIQWQRTLTNPGKDRGLQPYDVADGTGSPGEVENDTIVYAHTVVVYTWMYMQKADGTWGWVSLGYTVYTYPTQKQ